MPSQACAHAHRSCMGSFGMAQCVCARVCVCVYVCVCGDAPLEGEGVPEDRQAEAPTLPYTHGHMDTLGYIWTCSGSSKTYTRAACVLILQHGIACTREAEVRMDRARNRDLQGPVVGFN